ncbi:MAG: hypothetical protein KDC44_03555 [Phaeodactylibacter sp.]|nr:hypothetical protein [Phaeodactylibacter sp.]
MSKQTLGIFLLCIGFLTPTGGWAQMAIDVTGSVDSKELLIGDQLRLHLRVDALQPVQLKDPTLENFDKQEIFEVLEDTPWDTIRKGTQLQYTKDLIMTAWDTGFHHIPAVTIPYTFQGKLQKGSTLPIPIEVVAMPVDTTQLAPIKPIIKEPFKLIDALPIFLSVLIFVLLILGAVFWSRRQKKGRTIQVEPTRPAHEVALEQLAALESKQLWQSGQIKNYHSELNHILRAYLGGRFRIKALEASSSEINGQLQALEALEAEQLTSIRDMLGKVDLIKFAQGQAPTSFHAEAMQEVRSFVEQTKALPIEDPDAELRHYILAPEDEVITTAARHGLDQRMSIAAIQEFIPKLLQLPEYQGPHQQVTFYRWSYSYWWGSIRREKLILPLPESIAHWHTDNQSDFWKLLNTWGGGFTRIPVLGGLLFVLLFLLLGVLSPVFILLDVRQGRKILGRGKIQLKRKEIVLIDYTILSENPQTTLV